MVSLTVRELFNLYASGSIIIPINFMWDLIVKGTFNFENKIMVNKWKQIKICSLHWIHLSACIVIEIFICNAHHLKEKKSIFFNTWFIQRPFYPCLPKQLPHGVDKTFHAVCCIKTSGNFQADDNWFCLRVISLSCVISMKLY